MTSPPPPPPRRAVPASLADTSSREPAPPKSGWKGKASAWGKVAVAKGTILSDRVGVKVNGYSEAMGSERFWPTTNDFPEEMNKAARILRAFTVEAKEETVEEKTATGKKQQKKVLKRIPPKIIRDAKGLAIFTSMRTGIAPFGGAGGAGLIVARLPDGSWSAPSSTSPNNLSAGFMLGVDIYDAVLIIRTQAALDSFSGHKVTLGSEIGVAAGPYGSGAALEVGVEKSPVLSYIRTRGAYAGVEAVAQVFVERKEENELQYSWPGIRAADVLQGRVKVPREATLLIKALLEAEGRLPSGQVVDDPFAPPPTPPRRPTPSPPSAPVFESTGSPTLKASTSEPPPMPRRPAQSSPILQPDLAPTASPVFELSPDSPPPPAYPQDQTPGSSRIEEKEHEVQEQAVEEEEEQIHGLDRSADEKPVVMPGTFS